MKKCTLIIEDEVNCKFDNLDASIRHKIVDKLKFFMPYAYHVPAYKLGRWDGMKHFASINGRTQLNLITEDIISLITNAGYEIDIQDKRKQQVKRLHFFFDNYFFLCSTSFDSIIIL